MERYGTLPPKFTKAWWEHYWEYYKWHTVGAVLIAAMAAVTVAQFAMTINYDAVVTYIGEVSYYSEAAAEDVGTGLAKIVGDVNGNGSEDVKFQILSVAMTASGQQSPQYEMATETAKIFEIQTGESFLFIMDKTQINSIYLNGVLEGCFEKADNWLKNPSAQRAEDAAGEYFVKLPPNSIFTDNGFEPVEVYAGLRTLREDEDEEANKERLASIELANSLLK